MEVDLPAGCIGRSKEKWRPLKRVAAAAGGRWPAVADTLIVRDMAEEAAEREAGLKARPPGVVLLADLTEIWPGDEPFAPTRRLVFKLVPHNPDYWGPGSSYGKELTEQRFGRMLVQSAKVMSCRPGGGTAPRGYVRSQLEPIWNRLGIPHRQTGQTGQGGKPAEKEGDDGRSGRFNRSGPFGTGFIPQPVSAASTSAAITSRARGTGPDAAPLSKHASARSRCSSSSIGACSATPTRTTTSTGSAQKPTTRKENHDPIQAPQSQDPTRRPRQHREARTPPGSRQPCQRRAHGCGCERASNDGIHCAAT